jgi:hypothetical protein
VLSEVTEGGRTEYGVGNGMRHDIAIGCRFHPSFARNNDP